MADNDNTGRRHDGNSDSDSAFGAESLKPSTRAMSAIGSAENSVSETVSMDAESIEELQKVIDVEIFPALQKALDSDEDLVEVIQQNEVEAFLNTLLKQDYAGTVVFLETIRQRPVPLSVLFSQIMTPAARRLGEMWMNDECSFVEVTVGVSHLQRLVRDLSPLYQSDIPKSKQAGRVLFAATSGEQHTFGLSLLSEVFRRAGWDVSEAPTHSKADLTDLLKVQTYDIIGFSLSCVELADALRDDIALARSMQQESGAQIIVGGPAFLPEENLAATFDVDGKGDSAEIALHLAEKLLRSRSDKSSGLS